MLLSLSLFLKILIIGVTALAVVFVVTTICGYCLVRAFIRNQNDEDHDEDHEETDSLGNKYSR